MTELYKQYRPESFTQVIGQESACDTLKGFLKRDAVPHALLFFGPSGTGKTTLARILRVKMGCGDHDFDEKNSAQFRGIDTVREMQQQATASPMSGSCRVYLLDEVHKLSNDAQNGILKLLEDPPKTTYFMLCTTEPEKLIKTIRTRCTDVKTEPIKDADLDKLIRRVAREAMVPLKDSIVEKIVANSEGSARKALVLLDVTQGIKGEAEKLRAIESADERKKAIDLCRLLFKRGVKWKEVATMIKTDLKDEDPEGLRRMILAYANSIFLNSEQKIALVALQAFSENFYSSGKAGLTLACYEVVSEGR